MSYISQTKQTGQLKADGIDTAIAKIDSKLTKSFQLKVHDVTMLSDGDALKIQLEDLAVNVIETPTLHIHDYSDPYSDNPTQYADLHLFFPKAPASHAARQFIVKLSMQDNIAVYFHDFDEQMDINASPPQILFDTSEEFLGNSMMHCFIETTHSSEASFYMRSRNCVDVVNDAKNATTRGIWTLTTASLTSVLCVAEIRNYIETDEAKVWHSGSSMSLADAKPYIMFDKMKNVWIVADEDFGYATAWQSADAKELSFPAKRSKAVWTEA